jgi:Flp pilus assembly protein TadG
MKHNIDSASRLRRGFRRGGSLIETAICLGILLNLTFGAVEFGYYFYVKNMLDGAAREGCRAGIPPSAGSNTVVTSAVTGALTTCNFPNGCVTTAVTDTSNNAIDVSTVAVGTQIQVKVTATWSVIGAGFRPLNLIGGTKTVTGLCVMRKEG